jgi:AraC-like DNA-binding protein
MSKIIHSLSPQEFGNPARRHAWTSMMLKSYGMVCRLGTSGPGDGFVENCALGSLLSIDIKMANQRVSPTLRDSACWNGDHLFLKVIRHGSISIEQNGNTRTFGTESLLITDPLHSYSEIFNASTSVAILRISKESLKIRGLPSSFHDVLGRDLSSPDVMAVRDFALFLVERSGSIGRDVAGRMSQHCMDLMDIVLNDGTKSGRNRTGASALVLRAKQVITRLARNPNLDVGWIARELSVSPNYLTRAFRATGQTPMRYLMSVRLQLARKLLAERNPKVKEISFQCGFSSSSHFCTAFKREFGASPLEFAHRPGEQ